MVAIWGAFSLEALWGFTSHLWFVCAATRVFAAKL